jgi:hypothetical protein
VLLAGAAVAAIALVACTPLTPAPPKRSATEPLHVDVVGDSLIRQAGPHIERRLVLGGFPHRIASEPRVDLRSAFVRGFLDQVAGNGGDILVISTANNDAIVQRRMAATSDQNTAQWAYRNDLGDVVHRFGDRCVVVVNAKEDISPFYDPAQAATLNSNLRDERTRRANLVIADWAAWSLFVPKDQFMADQFHFGPDPYSSAGVLGSADAFAGTIEGAVRQCASMLRP